ncbi:MAG: hypothetical protein ABII20_04670, partial [Candidatus Omnitrophota bacterium]
MNKFFLLSVLCGVFIFSSNSAHAAQEDLKESLASDMQYYERVIKPAGKSAQINFLNRLIQKYETKGIDSMYLIPVEENLRLLQQSEEKPAKDLDDEIRKLEKTIEAEEKENLRQPKRNSQYQQENWTGNINIYFGAKALKEEDWTPVEEQDEAGIAFDFKEQHWPVSLVVDYSNSIGEGTFYYYGWIDCEAKLSELNIGIRKIWDRNLNVRPFIGGGISFIRGEVTYSSGGYDLGSISDSGTGYWIGGGVYWTLNESFNIGLEMKSSYAKITIGD